MGLAALSGWCNLIPMISPSITWTDIAKHSTNMEDLQEVIGRAVADTSTQQCMEINTFHLTGDMLNDIVKIDLAPGWGLPVWFNLQHGICILNLLPTSAGQVTEIQQIEDNCREKQNMRTFVDAQRRNKADPQMPADTYEALKKNVATYGMYLLTLFGHNCQH